MCMKTKVKNVVRYLLYGIRSSLVEDVKSEFLRELFVKIKKNKNKIINKTTDYRIINKTILTNK